MPLLFWHEPQLLYVSYATLPIWPENFYHTSSTGTRLLHIGIKRGRPNSAWRVSPTQSLTLCCSVMYHGPLILTEISVALRQTSRFLKCQSWTTRTCPYFDFIYMHMLMTLYLEFLKKFHKYSSSSSSLKFHNLLEKNLINCIF